MNFPAKIALALFVAAPLTSSAQTRTVTSIAAGPAFPISSFRDTQSRGFDLTAGIIRGSDESPFGVRLDFEYGQFPGKTSAGVSYPDKHLVAGTIDLEFSTSGYTHRPYLVAGVGAFKLTSKPEALESKTRFGFDFGAGVTMPLGSNALYLESRVNSISQHNAKPLRYLPIVLGILF